MKAVRLHDYGGPEVLVYEDAPDPRPGPGEMLVRVEAAGVNPLDWKIRRGDFRDLMPRKLPAIPGWDVVGVVRETRGTDHGFNPGQRVLGFLDLLRDGAYAELVVAKISSFVQVPIGVDRFKAAALPTVGLTGTQLIERGLRVTKGQRILVAGALGSVGGIAVQMAVRAGAEVYAGVRGSQVEMARLLPIAGVLAIDDPVAVERAAGSFDGVADTVGGTAGEWLVRVVRPGGRFVTIAGPIPMVPAKSDIYVDFLRVQPDSEMLSRLLMHFGARMLDVPLQRTFPLSEARRAHEFGEAGSSGKMVLSVE